MVLISMLREVSTVYTEYNLNKYKWFLLIKLTMDYSGRLMCIIIVLCTLNALTVRQGNNTDFTNEFVTKQNIEINGITMDGTHDKNGMTSGSTSNQQKLDMFTIAFTSHNKNPSSRTRNVLYFNATQIPLSDNNGFINLKSTLDSTKLSSNSPRRREMQSNKRLTVTDSLKIYSLDYQITQATVNRMHSSKGPHAVTTQEVVDSASRVPFSITSYDNSKHITSTHKFILDKNSPTKTTSSFRLKHDICHQYGGCKLVSGPYWYCQCDDSCEEYNDCCMDYTLNKKNNKQNYTCTSIEGSSLNLWGIQTISSCPPDHKNNSLNTQCSKGLMTKVGPPVLDINDKSRVYRNKYCAMCHGAAAVYLDIAFTLNPSLFRETDILLNMTDVEFKDHLFRVATYRLLIPREANVRYCLINLFRNDDALCNHYSNPILYKTTNRFYRNDFCRESTDNLSTICVYNIMDSLIADLMRSPILLKKLTILFSFDQNNALSTEDRCQQWSEKVSCKNIKYIGVCKYVLSHITNITKKRNMSSFMW